EVTMTLTIFPCLPDKTLAAVNTLGVWLAEEHLTHSAAPPQADLVVLAGSNAAWTHPVLYQRLVQARAANPAMKVVVIDPRRTATCDIADLHIKLAPGSDAGLFVGLLNALGAGDSEAQQRARDWPVSRVATFCELPTRVVETFYQWFIAAPRAITLYTMGINQS
ncbi:molybdopterin-dependent oxidoreductase, partial [Escherichia coli]|nr:molybdopterin-dependent oxidoreductase [Escherichia coli]